MNIVYASYIEYNVSCNMCIMDFDASSTTLTNFVQVFSSSACISPSLCLSSILLIIQKIKFNHCLLETKWLNDSHHFRNSFIFNNIFFSSFFFSLALYFSFKNIFFSFPFNRSDKKLLILT